MSTDATGRSTSGSADILSVLRWLEDSEHWIGNVPVGNVQFGWEITSSSGGMNFQANSYLDLLRLTLDSTC